MVSRKNKNLFAYGKRSQGKRIPSSPLPTYFSTPHKFILAQPLSNNVLPPTHQPPPHTIPPHKKSETISIFFYSSKITSLDSSPNYSPKSQKCRPKCLSLFTYHYVKMFQEPSNTTHPKPNKVSLSKTTSFIL